VAPCAVPTGRSAAEWSPDLPRPADGRSSPGGRGHPARRNWTRGTRPVVVSPGDHGPAVVAVVLRPARRRLPTGQRPAAAWSRQELRAVGWTPPAPIAARQAISPCRRPGLRVPGRCPPVVVPPVVSRGACRRRPPSSSGRRPRAVVVSRRRGPRCRRAVEGTNVLWGSRPARRATCGGGGPPAAGATKNPRGAFLRRGGVGWVYLTSGAGAATGAAAGAFAATSARKAR